MAGGEQSAVALRWTEQGFGQGRLELADELVAEDFVNHNAIAGQVPGREGLKAAVAMLRSARPVGQRGGRDR
jgi:SnoaL-like polyketide cyclase